MLFYIKTRDGRNASTNGSPSNAFCRSPIGRRLRVSRFGRGAPRRAAKLTLNFRARQKKIPKSDSDRFWRFFNLRAREVESGKKREKKKVENEEWSGGIDNFERDDETDEKMKFARNCSVPPRK